MIPLGMTKVPEYTKFRCPRSFQIVKPVEESTTKVGSQLEEDDLDVNHKMLIILTKLRILAFSYLPLILPLCIYIYIHKYIYIYILYLYVVC